MIKDCRSGFGGYDKAVALTFDGVNKSGCRILNLANLLLASCGEGGTRFFCKSTHNSRSRRFSTGPIVRSGLDFLNQFS